MFREVCSVFSFLTVIPSCNAPLRTVARHMYVFPLAGAVIGLIVGGLGLGLSEIGVDPLVIGLLVVAGTAILTGIHHTDGLADFADGLMARGTRDKKLSVMKDVSTGSAGTTAIVLYCVGMVAALSLTGGMELLKGILFAEIAAKFSMVLMAYAGRPAAPGSSAPFSALVDKKRLAAAAAITSAPLVILGGVPGLVVLAAGVTTTLILTALSHRSFGGITGDVLGAANELSRLAALLAFVSV